MTRPNITFVLLTCTCWFCSNLHAQSGNGDSLAKAIDARMILVGGGSPEQCEITTVRMGFDNDRSAHVGFRLAAAK